MEKRLPPRTANHTYARQSPPSTTATGVSSGQDLAVENISDKQRQSIRRIESAYSIDSHLSKYPDWNGM